MQRPQAALRFLKSISSIIYFPCQPTGQCFSPAPWLGARNQHIWALLANLGILPWRSGLSGLSNHHCLPPSTSVPRTSILPLPRRSPWQPRLAGMVTVTPWIEQKVAVCRPAWLLHLDALSSWEGVDCSSTRPGQGTAPGVPHTSLALETYLFIAMLPANISHVSSNSAEPPTWDEDAVAHGHSGEGQIPSTGLQPMRLPRGQHEEAVLCPVPSPTLLPSRWGPGDTGSALPHAVPTEQGLSPDRGPGP